MIFDKEYYDNSLWLMLKADKKNRMVIVNFIKSIPEELFNKIKDSISLFKQCREGSIGLSVQMLSGAYETNEKVLYWYQIDNIGNLVLGYRLYTGKYYESVMTLGLNINEDLSKALDVGYIVYHGDKCERSDYVYIAYTDTVYTEFVNTGKFKINDANVDSIPKEMFMSDINNKKNINRLVRGKNRRF